MDGVYKSGCVRCAELFSCGERVIGGSGWSEAEEVGRLGIEVFVDGCYLVVEVVGEGFAELL